MDQQRIILDSSPLYVVLCAVLAAGLAYLLYRSKHPWPKIWNQCLFVARFILMFILLFLLLGPIVKQVSNYFEKPLFVIVRDNSASIKQGTDSTALKSFEGKLKETEDALVDKGFEVKTVDLGGNELTSLNFNGNSTDLHYALKQISQQYEGKNINGVIFPTDGIFTTGLSPLYDQYNFPVYSIGIGDTTERTDASVKNIGFNRIAYQGNKFPVRVEVQLKNLQNENIEVIISRKGKQLDKLIKKSGTDQFLIFDFTPLADEQGIQKLDIHVTEKPGERNVRNNRASIFVEVVEGKKKILLVASSPHPDIKPIREVISQNSNYEFILHIPGIEEEALKTINPEKIDLVIFHQSPDIRGRSTPVFQQFLKGKSSLLFIIGQQTDLRTIAQNGLPLRFDTPPREFDQVTPIINPVFNNFIVSPETISMIQEYPPVSVHFGRVRISQTAVPLLLQKVGNLSTQKPLLALENQQGRKIGVMLGEGLWRWRLNEFDRTEKTLGFDELFGKLIQYLSTTDDKRKFKSYPIQQDFSDTEAVVFESQVYNDIFEPVYGNKIDIEITDEKGQKKNYNYITSSGNIRYQIGGLKEGVYKYKSRTTIQGTNEEVRGEFAVVAKQAELQNLTADFDLLRKLASNTGGKFYTANATENLKTELLAKETKNVIHSEETFESLVNLKWVFWLLVIFIAMEWFVRKFFGSY
jgi:hypothetical protein